MKKIIDLAIVVPTLNEEYFIGGLLDSIIKQTVQPNQLVVVDAFSEDKTLLEIKKRQKSLPQIRVYQIPRVTISRQRNHGAVNTASKHIIFLDADTILMQQNTLANYYQEILDKKPDIAAAFNQPLSDYWKDRIFFWMMNTTFKLTKPIWPIITGMNLYLSRRAFNDLKGFDESIRIGEDLDLVQRAAKRKLKLIFLKSVKVHTSVRRFAKEGRRKFIFESAKALYSILRYGHKHNPMEYEFGNFEKP